ncbi:MAG: hypothetical protein IPN67_07995 [Bacteroidales bacterium]|nr:hypothetical protein [Bacteroidales bacterium]
MKFKTISLCILFVMTILSCQKDELSVVDKTEVMYLSNVMIDDEPYYEYFYNDSNLVSGESSKLDYMVHHYNALNQLVSSDYYWNKSIMSTDIKTIETTLSQSAMITSASGTKGGSFQYEYSNDLLAKVTFSRPQSGSSEYSVFSYNELNRINKQILYWNETQTGYIDYLYDFKGNLIKESLYDISESGVAELSTTTKYLFDGKHNPYKSFKGIMIPGLYTNYNNIIKEVYTVYVKPGQGTDQVQVTENSYEYNINGYPEVKNGNIKYLYE